AAKFRLRQKANRLRQRIEVHGRDEALFQAIAEALGYKQNRLPFTLLAQRLPLAFLRKRREDAEALLFGFAGFLDTPDLDRQRKSTRSYLRSLWDRWWKYREQFSRLVLPAKLWKTSGTRPLNHPHRRLGALAVMVAEWKTFSALAGASKATPLVSFLTDLRHDFWSRHYSLAAASASSSLALIGNSRAAEILANLVYPLAVNDDREIWNDYKNLRAQLSNQAARIAAARLRALLGRTTGIAPNLRRFLPARCLRLRELSVTGAIAEMVKTSFQSSFLVGTEPFSSFRAKAEESLTIDENKVRDVSTSSPGVFCGMLGKDGK